MTTQRVIQVRIELPEDATDDVTSIVGMEVSLSADNINPEAIPALILKAAEFLVQGRLTEQYATSMPMLQGDMLDSIAASEARLAIIDTIMHLPSTGATDRIETTLPM